MCSTVGVCEAEYIANGSLNSAVSGQAWARLELLQQVGAWMASNHILREQNRPIVNDNDFKKRALHGLLIKTCEARVQLI